MTNQNTVKYIHGSNLTISVMKFVVESFMTPHSGFGYVYLFLSVLYIVCYTHWISADLKVETDITSISASPNLDDVCQDLQN